MANIFVRHEKKFLITTEQMNIILDTFKDKLEVDKYSKNGYSYVHNIYFDTINNDVIRESVSRPIYKEKLRLRSYQLLNSESDFVYLEIKKKYNGIGNKRRIKLKYNEAMDFVLNRKIPKFDDYLQNQIVLEIDSFLDKNKVIPAIFISSTRLAYYAKDDENFRITFDKDVKYRRDNVNLLNEEGVNFLNDNEVIMEVKFKDSLPLDFVKLLSSLNIYKTRFSKYGKIYEYELKSK